MFEIVRAHGSRPRCRQTTRKPQKTGLGNRERCRSSRFLALRYRALYVMSSRTLNAIGELVYFFALSVGAFVSLTVQVNLLLSFCLYVGASALDVVSTLAGLKTGNVYESNPIAAKFGIGWKTELAILLTQFFAATLFSILLNETFFQGLSRVFVLATTTRLGAAVNNFFLLQMVRRGRNGS